MRRIVPILMVALAAACHDTATMPSEGPALAKGGKPGPPSAAYDFAYAWAPTQLGSDCWRPKYGDEGVMPPPEFPELEIGDPIPRTMWCSGSSPTLTLQVNEIDGDGDPIAPATGGSVTFGRCMDTRINEPVSWMYCGTIAMRRGGSGRFYKTVVLTERPVGETGLVTLALADWNENIWGMRWAYDVGDGKKAEAEEHWFDFGPVGYDGGPG